MDNGAQRRIRRARWDDRVYLELQKLVNGDPTASASTLEARLATQVEPPLPATPDAKTINDWFGKGWIHRPAPEDLWRLADAGAAEARYVLPVLAAVVARTRGAIRGFTRAEASWIARLREASDERIPGWLAFAIATTYLHRLRREREGPAEITRDRTSVDLYLAFAAARGWTEPGAEYTEAAQGAGLPVVSFGPWEEPS